MRQTIAMACAAVLLLSTANAAGDPDADAELRKQADRERVQARFAKHADAASEVLVRATAGSVVASLDVRPILDLPALHQDAATLKSILMQRFRGAGLLVYPYETDRKVEVKYEAGNLPKGLLASDGDVSSLTGKEVAWLLVPRLMSDDFGASARLELYDLRTRKRSVKTEIGPIPTKSFTMGEIGGPDRLPPRNTRLLWFAVENFGRTVDHGECWDLPAVPIKADGGTVNGYSFGKEIPWEEGRSGDVITFGTSGDTGGHVVLLLRWAADRSKATVLHQNWGGNRTVMVAALGGIEGAKAGQPLRLWRP